MHPTSISSDDLSALTALGQMLGHLPRPERAGDVTRVLDAFDGVARQVAAILLDDPSAADASDEAHDIAWAIQRWVTDDRRPAAALPAEAR